MNSCPSTTVRRSFVRRTIILGSAFAIPLACHPKTPPQEPIDLIAQMCCQVANKELTKFAGCRQDHRHCEDNEPIWIRGAITCSEVREESCLGGRCCQYRPQYGSDDAVLNWEPDDQPAPENDAPNPTPSDGSGESPSEANQ